MLENSKLGSSNLEMKDLTWNLVFQALLKCSVLLNWKNGRSNFCTMDKWVSISLTLSPRLILGRIFQFFWSGIRHYDLGYKWGLHKVGRLGLLNKNQSGDKHRQVSQVNFTDILDHKRNIWKTLRTEFFR
jgi:hypothetical protein